MTRLPTPGGDKGNWGEVLNSFLSASHNSNGSLKSSALVAAGSVQTSDKGSASGVASLDSSGYVPTAQLQNPITTSLSDKGGQVFNVKAYGAVGDGSTNDTSAIQSAIDAATSGGTIFFPHGTYNIASSLTITVSGVSLVGAGSGASVIQAASGSEAIAMVVVGNGTDTCADTNIRELHFDSVNQKTAGATVRLQKCFRTHLQNLRFDKQYRDLHVFNSTETWLSDSDIRDSAESAIVFEAELSSGYDLYLSNITADNPTVSNSGFGLEWLGGENLVVNNCDLLNFSTGLLVSPPTGQQARFGFFSTAEFDTSSNNGIEINNKSGGDVVGLTFTNTWTGTATNYGVLIDGTGTGTLQGIDFIGHKSMHNGLAGIRVTGSAQNVHITNPIVVGNSQTSANSRSGIEMAGGSGWSIIGGYSGNGYQQGNTQDHGINVDSGSYSECLIGGVDVSNNTNSGLSLNSATGIGTLATTKELDNGNVSGSVTFDRTNASVQVATLTGDINVTLSNWSIQGDTLTLKLVQDGTGGHSVTWPSNFKKAGGTLTLSAGAAAVDVIQMVWDGSNWNEVSRSQNLS